jgi:hypothetical protein
VTAAARALANDDCQRETMASGVGSIRRATPTERQRAESARARRWGCEQRVPRPAAGHTTGRRDSRTSNGTSAANPRKAVAIARMNGTSETCVAATWTAYPP